MGILRRRKGPSQAPLSPAILARQAALKATEQRATGAKHAAMQVRLAEVEEQLKAWRWPHDPASVMQRYLAEEAEARTAKRSAEFARAYCTKHMWSGRRLVNTYGGIHLTPGPECDGGQHRRGPFSH
jgi:hypothetical protein